MTPSIDPIQDALRHRAFKCAGRHEPRCRTLLAFLVTSHRVRTFLKHSLSKQQLTETGFRILATLVAHEDAPLSPTQISSLASMWPPTVTDVITRLEISGLITRERSTADRRQVLIRLTPAGHKHYTSAVDHLVGDMVRLAEPIAPAEFAVLRTACDHLDSRVAQLTENAGAGSSPASGITAAPEKEAAHA
ncbi:transcriptional regulator [Opitutaceae bacterium TAV1]|nr:transcriptional regulator [Opitutaceae bacterium TAV1]